MSETDKPRGISALQVSNDSDVYLRNKRIAEVKYALIAPVITETLNGENHSEYYKRIENHEVVFPDGSIHKFKAETYKYWAFLYRKHGIEGLMPKQRSDFGKTRRLNNEAKLFITDQIVKHPKITGQLIYDRMIEAGIMSEGDVSVDTVQRYIKKNGIREDLNPAKTERRAWEYEHACDGYEADTAYTLYVKDENGKVRRTYLIAIIDDASRLIVGAEFFFNDNAVNFHKVWKSAVKRYGRSKVMILDNGSSYKNAATKSISARLGTKLVYCKPYTPQGKAKIERFFLRVRQQWLNADNGEAYENIDDLNEKLREWIAVYNRTDHEGLTGRDDNCNTPMKRFMKDMHDISPHQTANIRKNEYNEWVENCFLYEEKHRVNADSSVKVMNMSFDAPAKYSGSMVIIQYEPGNPERVYLYDPANKEKIKLEKTDKVSNSKKRREEIIY